MSKSLIEVTETFSGLHVVVVGEAMLDSYLTGSPSGLCREAPVPIIALEDRRNVPGGAANTAANMSALGARVTFLSVVGADDESAFLRASLQEHGVPTEGIVEHGKRRTLTKNRIVSDSQILLRFDQGTTAPLDGETERMLLERLEEAYASADAVVLSDYDKGILTPTILDGVAALQSRHPRLLVADARDLSRYRRIRPTAVKPNYAEAVRLLGLPRLEPGPARLDQISRIADRLLYVTRSQLAAVTLDVDGALLIERSGAPYRTYSKPVRNSRALGAGDTFTGALTLALAAGAATHTAAELASAAAAVVIGKEGTGICSDSELREHLFAQDKHVDDLGRLVSRAEFYRRQGRRIVFTNGCFDILHRGHITYLVRAKSLGDVLVVGINSDAGVGRLKGPDRPINALEDRVQVLAALSCIDLITSFDEDTPARLIEAIRPDVFVKGGDYTRETIPEADLVESLGGTVHVVPYVAGRSTTRIIERIGKSARSGGADQVVHIPEPSREDGERKPRGAGLR